MNIDRRSCALCVSDESTGISHRYPPLCRDLSLHDPYTPVDRPDCFQLDLDLRQPLPHDNRIDTHFSRVDNNRERVRERGIDRFFFQRLTASFPPTPPPLVGGARSNEMIIASAKCKVSTKGGEKVKEEGCTVIAIDCGRSNGRHGECTWIPFHPRISDIRR